MTAASPTTPPGPPPVEALAAEIEAEASAPSDSPNRAYRALMLEEFAQLLRDRLAPAWDALARERDNFRHAHRNWAAEGNRLHDENASLREQLAVANTTAGNYRVGMLQARSDLNEAREQLAETKRDLSHTMAVDAAELKRTRAELAAELDKLRRERDTWKAVHDSREAECSSLRQLRAEDLNRHRAELAARPVALPNPHAHPQDQFEEWVSGEYEGGGSDGCSFEREDLMGAYEAGWAKYRDLARKALEARDER